MTKQPDKKYFSLPADKFAEFIELGLKLMSEDKRKAFIDRKKKIKPVPVKFKLD